MTVHKHNIDRLARRAKEAYRVRQGNRLLPSQDKALDDIGDCRTAAMGGHRYRCAECDETFWVYHACGNRACPACHGRDTRAWLEKRQAQLLGCGYFHVVATVPAPIRAAFLAHQKTMYGLMDLARNERFVGGMPGILMVLHTWTGELHYHPHVHLLVTAGGITDDGQHWRDPKSKDFLVPVKALSKLIRRRFGEALKQLKPDLYNSVPLEAWINGWNTFCKRGTSSGSPSPTRASWTWTTTTSPSGTRTGPRRHGAIAGSTTLISSTGFSGTSCRRDFTRCATTVCGTTRSATSSRRGGCWNSRLHGPRRRRPIPRPPRSPSWCRRSRPWPRKTNRS